MPAVHPFELRNEQRGKITKKFPRNCNYVDNCCIFAVQFANSSIIMKKISAIFFLAIIVILSVSCKRDCVCTGVHPSTEEANETHNYGKMTKEECQDKQFRMNKDTVFATNKTWVCEQ